MKKLGLNILLVIFLSIGIFSCNTDETCRKSRTVLLGMDFYLDTINRQTNRMVVQKLTIDSLWVLGENLDGYFYMKQKTNTIKLPLKVFDNETRFQMRFNKTTDTVTIKYKNLTEFLSLDCGYIRTHEIDTVISTKNFIDSITILNKKVGTTYVENIKIHHNK